MLHLNEQRSKPSKPMSGLGFHAFWIESFGITVWGLGLEGTQTSALQKGNMIAASRMSSQAGEECNCGASSAHKVDTLNITVT